MKRTEVAMIILIAALSMFATFTVATQFLADKVQRSAVVEKATVVTDEITKPAKRVFNSDAINPTVEVCVETASVDASADTSADDCRMTTPVNNTDDSTSAAGDSSTNTANKSSTN